MATTDKKTTAVDVAKYFVLLAAADGEGDCLTPMRLQKLLYYVQGWSLVHRGQPMFSEEIQAWVHGPVVPEVFQEFKKFGRNAIPQELGSDANLSTEQKEFVQNVWATYRAYSAFSLSDMTHEEAPWKDARKGFARAEQCAEVITAEAMKTYFSSLAVKK